jgi:hypothetical protein
MANKQITGDMSVFSIGGTSVLAVCRNVTYDLEFDKVDGSPVLVQGRQTQLMKRGGTIDTTLMSTISDGLRVNALDCSVFTIGGTDYLALLKSLRFNGALETEDSEGATGAWKWFQYKGKKDYTAEADLFLPITAAGALGVLAHGASRTALDLAISMTINSIPITVPMTAHKFTHMFDDGQFQMYKVALSGKAPDSLVTAYPTAPTGTTSLLEKAFNAPGTALAFALTSHATEGLVYSGNMVYSKFNFEIADGQLISNTYGFQTQGAITAAQN